MHSLSVGVHTQHKHSLEYLRASALSFCPAEVPGAAGRQEAPPIPNSFSSDSNWGPQPAPSLSCYHACMKPSLHKHTFFSLSLRHNPTETFFYTIFKPSDTRRPNQLTSSQYQLLHSRLLTSSKNQVLPLLRFSISCPPPPILHPLTLLPPPSSSWPSHWQLALIIAVKNGAVTPTIPPPQHSYSMTLHFLVTGARPVFASLPLHPSVLLSLSSAAFCFLLVLLPKYCILT